jgi:hypothetical protein
MRPVLCLVVFCSFFFLLRKLGADLFCSQDAYEATFTEDPLGLWAELMSMMGIRKRKKVVEVRI